MTLSGGKLNEDSYMKPDVATENIEAAAKDIGIFRKFFMNSNGGTQ